jgi:hypothetical protein
LYDFGSHFSNAISEGEEVSYAGQITRRLSRKDHIQPAEQIAGKQRRQYPLVAAADSSPRPHPWQKHFQMKIHEPFFDLLFAVHFGLYRVPAQTRLDLKRLMFHVLCTHLKQPHVKDLTSCLYHNARRSSIAKVGDTYIFLDFGHKSSFNAIAWTSGELKKALFDRV